MHAEPEGTRHYVLGRKLGAGGMGEVYSATDVVLGREVAIKYVTTSGTPDDTGTLRLLQEAQAVAALDHPYICPVYEAGVDPRGRPYMVMQYVHGETLASRLSRGVLPVREALSLCHGIAEALGAAHRRGIVHRDLKPQNVMITPDGRPKLLDFGIAKLVHAIEPDAATTVSSPDLTGTYALVGTPGYMSPEQIERGPVDGRSDLFSLGAILYECLTGRRAFSGEDSVAVMGRIVHAHPQPPSAYRPELDSRHDQICDRLLAKDPGDRFQSADEVVGALRMLLPDTSRSGAAEPISGTRRWWEPLSRRRRQLLAATVVAAAVLVGVIVGPWWLSPSLPPAPLDAQRWYNRGTEALREGAFHSAAAALEEAVRVFPQYPVAYARLAEARAEMDDERAAQEALVRLSERVPDLSRLPTDERLRLDAIRSLVLRDVDAAVRSYRELAEQRGTDPSAWLDLGRAQEAAGQLGDARASYERARTFDAQYAAAYLRLSIIESNEARADASLKALAEAERLYGVSSNAEGSAEVLIRRGSLYNAIGELRQARASLEQALSTARAIRSPFHAIRAEMYLSSVTASEGRFADAERLATSAVQSALDARMETWAAEGLIDLAAALTQASRYDEAESQLLKAIDLAQKRGAHRIEARARLQRAALHLQQNRVSVALEMVQQPLEYFRRHKYRRYELTALNIASRAHQELDHLPEAHKLASEVLAVAETMKNETQVALALGNLAAQATTLGSLPEALSLRDRAEQIHRRQRSIASLPYDLTNRAELLIRLGRLDDANRALSEVDEGIEKGLAAYVGRRRRVMFLRALASVVAGNYPDAAARAKEFAVESGGADSASALGDVLFDFARAKQGAGRQPRRPEAGTKGAPETPPAFARERQYWLAAAALARREAREALALSSAGLEQLTRVRNDELEWRLAAVGTAAASQLENLDQQRTLRARALDSLTRLRSQWGEHGRSYEARGDLAALRAAAGL